MKAEVSEKTILPPHSEEAERGVIGSCLLEPIRVMALCSDAGVIPKSFHIPAYRLIYTTMLEMRPETIDTLTVTERLATKERLDAAGGPLATDKCIEVTPTAAHADYYIDIVRKKEKKRRIIECARRAEDACRTAADDSAVEDIASSAATALMGIVAQEAHVQTYAQIHDEFLREIRGEQAIAIPSRWGVLNNTIIGYQSKDYIIVAARPSDGKTTMMLNDACHVAINLGLPVGIFTPDTTRKKLLRRMACHLAGVNYMHLVGGGATDGDIKRVSEKFKILEKAPIYIDDRTPTISQLCARATAMKQKYGVVLIVVDYIQQLRLSSGEDNNNRVNVVGGWSGKLKSLFKDIDVVGMVLSQLNRGGDRFLTKTPPPPTLEALRDTGNIEQDADIVIFLYKKPGQDAASMFIMDKDWPMEWYVAKNKDGPTGMFPMTFVRKHYTYMTEQEHGCDTRYTGGAGYADEV